MMATESSDKKTDCYAKMKESIEIPNTRNITIT